MERHAWCYIAGQDRLLHVDITNCAIVYDLKKSTVDLSRIKIPLPRVDIWKVSRQKATRPTFNRLLRSKSRTSGQLKAYPRRTISQTTMTTFAWSLTFYSHKQSSRQYLPKGLTQSSLLWRSTAREKHSPQYPFQWVTIRVSPSLPLTQLRLTRNGASGALSRARTGYYRWTSRSPRTWDDWREILLVTQNYPLTIWKFGRCVKSRRVML